MVKAIILWSVRNVMFIFLLKKNEEIDKDYWVKEKMAKNRKQWETDTRERNTKNVKEKSRKQILIAMKSTFNILNMNI